MRKRKEIRLEDLFGGLTPEQRRELADQFNPSQTEAVRQYRREREAQEARLHGAGTSAGETSGAPAAGDYGAALETARGLLPSLNHCAEYDCAFVFTDTETPPAFGGFTAPVIVLKESGLTIPQAVFYDKYCPAFIREFDVPRETPAADQGTGEGE